MPLKFFFFCFAFLQFKGSKVCNVENVIELGLVLYTLENAKLRPVSRNHGILSLSLKIREISAYFPCQTYKNGLRVSTIKNFMQIPESKTF